MNFMKTVRASLWIHLYVNCPNCRKTFDLLMDTNLNDDGDLIRQALDWEVDADTRLEYSVEKCPYCGESFEVKGIDW